MKDIWLQERDELKAVLDDFGTGKLKLEQSQEDYVDSVKRRIAHLDEKLAKID